jgi:chromosome segregation ATPase
MMKAYQALLPLAAALAIMGCESRGSAEMMVSQAEAAVERVRPDATTVAPEELKTVEGTLAHMQQSLQAHEYQVVKTDVHQFNEQFKTLEDAITAGQTRQAATIQEWSTLHSQVPPMVEEVQAKVDSLRPNALPSEVTRDELEAAKQDLETVKATWDEANQAADAGKPEEAAEKGRTVLAKLNEIKSALGMSEQLASTAQPSAQAGAR